MTTERQDSGLCSIHKCPLQACPADCPNKHATSLDSEAKKEKYFFKEEVIREIIAIAHINGIEFNDLQPEPGGEEYDDEGNLLYFSMQATPARAREKKCGNIWYIYMVKGTHGPMGASEVTIIMKADSTIEKPDEVDWAEIVLEFNNSENKWIKP